MRIEPHDQLLLPLNKRVVVQYAAGDDGARELHLYCGAKEVIFDEPELFGFGETLAKHASFIAGSAVQWTVGYDWPQVRELLEQLVGEGVLVHGAEAADGFSSGPEGKDQPSPLPPAPSDRLRTWDEFEEITREIAGRPLEEGYLELVVPVFRVAHIALDQEGRQVGEANVFPRPLRVDVPTRWRTCIYPGSRYLDDKPMNVSALKAMRAHWNQAMGCLLRIRQAYLDRFPAARAVMTLGDVERLSTLVLAVATYPLVKKEGRVPSGDLHPVLSALFRVTDGLRMTTHQMLFLPVVEATLSPDTPVTAAEIHAYAERNYSLHSTQGVCAGPTAMIDQFLRVLVEGAEAEQFAGVAFAEPVQQALDDMRPAFDYGLLGLQAFATVFSMWPIMTRTYARMAQLVEAWIGPRTEILEKLDVYLRQKAETLRNETFHATEEWRGNRERVYADIYEKCAAGLGDPVRQSLPGRVSGRLSEQHRAPAEVLRGILQQRFGTEEGGDPSSVDWLVDTLMHFFVRTQQTLALCTETQHRINALLGREQPKRPFSATDVDIHVLLQAEEARRLPHLLDELERLLGFRVTITSDTLEVSNEILA
ncbi:hypothetical protein [Ramlibacter alkalitolerans]|uniref:Uncharacterized protein n=1 Tax=Ramlibacter alkalitolerans TaxID=2039631 RepID=A0ABS1JH41_9BURK|nr:hypothetical protein [Ramlibacter alkalitolerans]MBL0423537.1 hypothetical protein [Ramlibacter alkalitolerans]